MKLKTRFINGLIGDELKVLLTNNLVELKESFDCTGDCDHSVGMCVCSLKTAISDTQELLDRLNGKETCKRCGHAWEMSEISPGLCVYCEDSL